MSYTETFLNYLHSLPDALIYLLLGLSAYVENICPPIPGDTITAFGAFLVGIGRLDFFGVYICTTLGSLLGFMTLFWLGLYLGRRFFIKKDYRFFKAKDIIKAEEWYRKHGYLLVAFNRFLPGIRSVISLAGGLSRLRVAVVALLALLSCAVWNLIWILLGYVLGSNWGLFEARASAILTKYNLIVLVFVALVVLFFVLRKRFGKNADR
jgi:membrane protein DedA with SNARE-associated domain